MCLRHTSEPSQSPNRDMVSEPVLGFRVPVEAARPSERVAASWRRSRSARGGGVVRRQALSRGPARSRGGDAGVKEARPAVERRARAADFLR